MPQAGYAAMRLTPRSMVTQNMQERFRRWPIALARIIPLASCQTSVGQESDRENGDLEPASSCNLVAAGVIAKIDR
jgi:hypothetical protein